MFATWQRCNLPSTGLCFHNAIVLIILNFEQNVIITQFSWLPLYPGFNELINGGAWFTTVFTNLIEVGPSSNDITTADTHTVLTPHYFCLSTGRVRISQRSVVLFSLSYCVCVIIWLHHWCLLTICPKLGQICLSY